MSDTNRDGGFIADERNDEPGSTSGLVGSVNDQNGSVGNTRNVDSNSNRVDGFVNPTASVPTDRVGSDGSGDGNPRRTKRGTIDRRTKAGRNIQTETSGNLAPRKLVSLSDAILSLHDLAAGIFEIDELEIDENDAKRLSDAVLEVSKYHIEQFDPKKVAYFNLATVMAGVYGVRIMAYRKRMEKERAKKRLSLMPQPSPTTSQPIKQARTLEEYLGGMPPVEGASGL